MGKLGDVAAILGLGLAGGVVYMFATEKWKIPTLGDVIVNITEGISEGISEVASGIGAFFASLFGGEVPPWEQPYPITPVGEEVVAPFKWTIPPIVTKEVRAELDPYEQAKLAMQVGPYPPIPPGAIPQMIVGGLSEYEKMKLAMVGRMAPAPGALAEQLAPIPTNGDIRALQRGSEMERKMRGLML